MPACFEGAGRGRRAILARMKTPEEQRWERMQQALLAEAGGKGLVRVSSQRTLFGIKSHVDEVIDAVAAEDRARCEERLRR